MYPKHSNVKGLDCIALCRLGNFHKYFSKTPSEHQTGLDPDQGPHFFRPHLGLNYLQKLPAPLAVVRVNTIVHTSQHRTRGGGGGEQGF